MRADDSRFHECLGRRSLKSKGMRLEYPVGKGVVDEMLWIRGILI